MTGFLMSFRIQLVPKAVPIRRKCIASEVVTRQTNGEIDDTPVENRITIAIPRGSGFTFRASVGGFGEASEISWE